MKLSVATILLSLASASAFAPSATFIRKTTNLQSSNKMDMSGNSWKPDSEKMGSTDTGDYLPEGYEADVDFTSGMMGSQSTMGRQHDGPQLPGMENLGDDAVMMGGIEQNTEIPAGMEFVVSGAPDGEFAFQCSANGPGESFMIQVPPTCMTYEDYYAGFAQGSHKSLSVAPATGRMDRRGGDKSPMNIICNPEGASGDLVGALVINLPDDNSKICYKIVVKAL